MTQDEIRNLNHETMRVHEAEIRQLTEELGEENLTEATAFIVLCNYDDEIGRSILVAKDPSRDWEADRKPGNGLYGLFVAPRKSLALSSAYLARALTIPELLVLVVDHGRLIYYGVR